MLICEDAAVMEAAAERRSAARKPLLYAATNDNYEAMTALAQRLEAPLL